MDDTEQTVAIDYELLVEDALRTVVRSSLALVEHEGLPGDNHFYISFQTTADGVQMSEALKVANPQEMTIVLQHQFWDLHVSETHFSVTLSFSGVHHNLNVPFSAVTHFNDPSVGFGLQFSAPDALEEPQHDKNSTLGKISDISHPKIDIAEDKKSKKAPEQGKNKPVIQEVAPAGDGAEIVSLGRFRKDPAPKE